MIILRLTLSFQLPGCRSLKEKRSRLKTLRDRFGSSAHIAVAETDRQNEHGFACWQFIIISGDRGMIDAECSRIETFCQQLDAYVVACDREYLA